MLRGILRIGGYCLSTKGITLSSIVSQEKHLTALGNGGVVCDSIKIIHDLDTFVKV